MNRDRSRSPAPLAKSNGETKHNDEEFDLKRKLLLLTLTTVVRAGIEVVEKTLESRKNVTADRLNYTSQGSIPTQEYATQASDDAISVVHSPETVAASQSDQEDSQGSLVMFSQDPAKAAKLAWYGFHFHDGDDISGSPRYQRQKDCWGRKFKELGIYQNEPPSPLVIVDENDPDKKTIIRTY